MFALIRTNNVDKNTFGRYVPKNDVSDVRLTRIECKCTNNVFLSCIFLGTSRAKENLYERDDRDGHVGSRKVETVQTDNESTGRALFGDRRMHEDSRPHHSSTQPDASTLKYKRALGFAGLASLSHARLCWYHPFVLETRFFLIGQIFLNVCQIDINRKLNY